MAEAGDAALVEEVDVEVVVVAEEDDDALGEARLAAAEREAWVTGT